ncbi:MAG: ABC transporter ATP-binding protein [Fibrobacterota bacterium]
MEKSAIKAENLSCIFGSGKNAVIAVNSVNFDIRDEEIISIVGESGSGKTTLARMMLQLQKQSAGKLTFFGKEVTDLKEHWRTAQAIFQDPFASFNNFYTVKRLMKDSFNIMQGTYTEEEKVEIISEALRNVKLDPDALMDKYPFELSGGQMQRLLIARIFIIRPKFLIADEPTSMIDASSRGTILELLMDLKDKLKMSIIFITHDIGLAHYVSDRVFVMSQGNIVERGTPEEVIHTPKHPYTKKLLNDIPVLDKEWIDV